MNFTGIDFKEKTLSQRIILHKGLEKIFNNWPSSRKINIQSIFKPVKEKTAENQSLKEQSLWMLGIFAIYFLSGKLGLSLAIENQSVSAVWAPTGIAIAALILRGYYFWPVIFAGAFLVNITTTGDWLSSILIGAGNTLEALTAAYLVNKYADGKFAFQKVQNIFRFVFFAGVLSTLVSATIGAFSLSATGLAPWSGFSSVWLTWWLGDAIGAFLIAPLIILWANNDEEVSKLDNKRILEAAFVIFTLALIGIITFSPFSLVATNNYPFSYILIPPFVWIAFRFSKRFIATTAFGMCAFAVWGTLNGYGPFVVQSPSVSLIFLQIFICTITVMSISFSSVITERKKTQQIVNERENELSDYVDNVRLGMHWVGPDGKIIWANSFELSLLGYNKEEYQGHHISEFHEDQAKIN